MFKPLTGIILINLFLFSECNTMKRIYQKTYLDTDIYYNNEKLPTTYDNSRKLILEVEKLLGECDDLYELLVTDELIDDIKKNEDYLEICYPEKREINVGNVETIEIYKLLIPLSGKFAHSNQLTFFCGYPQYSSGPYIIDTGFEMLSDLIDRYKKKN